jgi:hypothetical protein
MWQIYSKAKIVDQPFQKKLKCQPIQRNHLGFMPLRFNSNPATGGHGSGQFSPPPKLKDSEQKIQRCKLQACSCKYNKTMHNYTTIADIKLWSQG